MMKFPTPKGVATLVTRTVIIAECRRLEKKQMIKESAGKKEKGSTQVSIKDNVGVFAWEPSDMTGVPHQVIEHMLNVNPSLDRVCQKQRMFTMEKSGVVANEVAELVKAGIVRPV
nr:hypothetical protein [Tanacetum cinerariifolium]